ncbi:MAG: DUF3786 domain-containing protein [Candidatus Adiutrix sp.]
MKKPLMLARHLVPAARLAADLSHFPLAAFKKRLIKISAKIFIGGKTMINKPARPEKGKLFVYLADLAPALWEDAALRPPLLVAASCGVLHEKGCFVVPFLGGNYTVNLSARTITAPLGYPETDFQTGMVLLSYLAHGQDIGLAGRLISGRELKGGEMFFKGSHAFLTEPVTSAFAQSGPEFVKAAGQLGARVTDEGSGHSVRLLALPHIEVGCVFHPADDEFAAELTYTFDAYAHYHLPLDAIWALINVLAAFLARRIPITP